MKHIVVRAENAVEDCINFIDEAITLNPPRNVKHLLVEEVVQSLYAAELYLHRQGETAQMVFSAAIAEELNRYIKSGNHSPELLLYRQLFVGQSTYLSQKYFTTVLAGEQR